MAAIKLPTFHNFGEYFFWSYANWMMYCAAYKDGAPSYKSSTYNYYRVRASWFKKLKDGDAEVHNMILNNIWKIEEGKDKCWYCGKAVAEGKITKDHILPLDKGGEDTFDNIALACKECNSSKGSKDFIDWYGHKFKYWPSNFMIGNYMKLVYKHAVAHNLMDKHVDEINSMDLPFDWHYLQIYDIPLPQD